MIVFGRISDDHLRERRDVQAGATLNGSNQVGSFIINYYAKGERSLPARTERRAGRRDTERKQPSGKWKLKTFAVTKH